MDAILFQTQSSMRAPPCVAAHKKIIFDVLSLMQKIGNIIVFSFNGVN
jgi:hypothetical protein